MSEPSHYPGAPPAPNCSPLLPASRPDAPRDPLILRVLLKIIRPSTVQGGVYKWTTLVSIPVYGYVYWGHRYLSEWGVFVGGTLLLWALGAPAILACNAFLERVTARYPEPQHVRQRVSIMVATLCLLFGPATLLWMWLLDATHLFGYRYNPATGPWIVASVMVVNLLMVGLFEITLAFTQWQTTQLETEQLEQAQLQGQLEEIKQKINPHFLFNSLNSLSVLIGEDAAQAERFVDEMAKVYRYLLQAHRGAPQQPQAPALTTLEAELRYIESYAYLLRTRYGTALEVDIAPGEGPRTGSLLPLTLQTLVDNAIRHNVVSAARPLRIAISTTAAGQVQVRNTRQRRSVRVPMVHDNLAALQARYHRLGGAPAVYVAATEQHFTVAIQLVAA